MRFYAKQTVRDMYSIFISNCYASTRLHDSILEGVGRRAKLWYYPHVLGQNLYKTSCVPTKRYIVCDGGRRQCNIVAKFSVSGTILYKMEVSTKRPAVHVMMISALCRSYTETERQHLFRVSRLFITCYYTYVSYYGLFVLDLSGIDHPAWDNLGDNWWWKCVSVWNLILQVVYFIYCTVFVDFADSFPEKTWMKLQLQKHKKIRDFFFISLVFPVTFEVCVMFWAICAVNKPLLFPKEMSRWIPDWFNHAVHTNPIVLTLFDMATTKHRLPKLAESTAGLFTLSGSYVACLLYIKFTTGRWVYLIIGEIATSFVELIIYFAVTAFVMPFLCLAIGYKLSFWFSSNRMKEEQKIS